MKNKMNHQKYGRGKVPTAGMSAPKGADSFKKGNTGGYKEGNKKSMFPGGKK